MATCPYCSEGHSSVEESGLKLHKFTDRWISCSAGPQELNNDRETGRVRADLMRIVLTTAPLLIRTLITRMPMHFK
jgi:hypothetical protein